MELIGEMGSDADGISREVYTIFWKEFMFSRCDGEYYKVPGLTPDYGIKEWTAIGQILVKGYIDHRVFPINFAPVFIIALILSEDAVNVDDLLKSFKLFLNNLDREIIEIVMSRGTSGLSSEDQDAFLELLDRYGCQHIPQEHTVKETLEKLAHKCLIQTPRKVCDLLVPPDDMNKDESQSIAFLKQYIRGLSEEKVAQLLGLMTASTMIAVDKVTITFTKLRGCERRPIFHTCGPVLELPSTYSTFRDLRMELDSIMNSGYFTMDIA